MEGLNQGLENGKKGLQQTLSGIADTISGTQFNATANLATAYGSNPALAAAGAGTTYNIYINDARINDDAQIRSNFTALLNEMARKGMM